MPLAGSAPGARSAQGQGRKQQAHQIVTGAVTHRFNMGVGVNIDPGANGNATGHILAIGQAQGQQGFSIGANIAAELI